MLYSSLAHWQHWNTLRVWRCNQERMRGTPNKHRMHMHVREILEGSFIKSQRSQDGIMLSVASCRPLRLTLVGWPQGSPSCERKRRTFYGYKERGAEEVIRKLRKELQGANLHRARGGRRPQWRLCSRWLSPPCAAVMVLPYLLNLLYFSS